MSATYATQHPERLRSLTTLCPPSEGGKEGGREGGREDVWRGEKGQF